MHFDHRGWFKKLAEVDELRTDLRFRSVAASFTLKGKIRGMHYQLRPYDEIKEVHVIQGMILDVALDLTTGKYRHAYLAPNTDPMIIQPWEAHGFQAVEDCHVLYLIDRPHSPERERRIHPFDPDLKLPWYTDIIPDDGIQLSDKDMNAPRWKDAQRF